ncbi:hypothetical protein ACTXJU_03575 [Glutamicibacter ardleyensis]|uniref:hypothetical protein n=1 Tax=Glutamicibacter ardleyensis TaxID=225894 RepID=UPI003FD67148
MPGLVRKTIGGGSHKWLGSAHGTHNAPTGTPNIEVFDEATHYPDGYIPAGTPVNAENLGALVPYTAPEADAPALNLGFTLENAPIEGGQAAPVAVLRHGSIVVEHVPGEFTAPAFAPGFIFE